jgi:hypothetical protein
VPRRRSGPSAFVAAVLALTFVALGVVRQSGIRLPPNSLPWEPVNLNEPPGWIAHWQLNRLAGKPVVCRAALTATPAAFELLKDRRIDDACGFTNVLRVRAGTVAFVPRVTATCGLISALFWYQRRLDGIARAQLHTSLTRIDQLGTFACRNVNSEAVGSRSEHATANAIDVAGFHFADGSTITVARDYGKPTPNGHFLDAAHDEACGLFNAVLGPHYNRLHANHFHLDMGPYRICS